VPRRMKFVAHEKRKGFGAGAGDSYKSTKGRRTGKEGGGSIRDPGKKFAGRQPKKSKKNEAEEMLQRRGGGGKGVFGISSGTVKSGGKQ